MHGIAESRRTPVRIRNLTDLQHQEAAALLRQAMDCLAGATSVVQQRPFTDATLTILGQIRRQLIGPLAAGLVAPFSSAENPYEDGPPQGATGRPD
jgi:hypothetical protein